MAEDQEPAAQTEPGPADALGMTLEELIDLRARLAGPQGPYLGHGWTRYLSPRLHDVLDLNAPGTGALIPMDAWRRGDAVVLAFDLPGVDAATIDLSLSEQILTVSAESAAPPDLEDAEVLVQERRHGLRTRQVVLGYDLDPGAISAAYAEGVLQVVIQMREVDQARHVIQVSTGPGGRPSDTADYVTLRIAGAGVPGNDEEPEHGRQAAPELDSVARDLLGGTFPAASDAAVRQASGILAASVLHDSEPQVLDAAEAQSTGRRLAEVLGNRTTD